MRLPKKVIVNNIPFKVVKDKRSMRASFSYSNSTVTIGTKTLADREVLDSFIHEIAEISSVERGVRSQRCKPQDSPEYLFAADHRAFSDVITDVSGVVAGLMGLRG